MRLPDLVMSVDVESRGLFGEAFAVGWVVCEHGQEVSSGFVGCPYDAARPGDGEPCPDDEGWVLTNVLPVLPPPSVGSPREVRDTFWAAWAALRRRGGVMLVECGHPVESRFLLDCIRDEPGRRAEFPRPILDLSDFLWAAGLDPLAEYPRQDDELPRHHPVHDARATARMFREVLATWDLAGTQPTSGK